MTMRYISGFNAFVAKATGQVISYIRDPKRYRLVDYVQMVRSPAPVGVYYKLDVDQPVRVESVDEDAWADGAMRPRNTHNQMRHDLVEFQCVRRNRGFEIGWQAIETADYKVLVAHSAMAQNQLMVARTQRVITLLETAGTWPGMTDTANNLNGGAGQWDLGSDDPTDANYLSIKKTLDAVAERIHLKTNGMVGDPEGDTKLCLIISPRAALKMSQSAEIHDYLKQSPFAMAQVKGAVPGQNAKWGLPDHLYGDWKIVVENAVRVSERPKASGAEASITAGSPIPKRFVKGNDTAIVVSRPGGLDGQYGSPSFSTVQIYYYEKEMDIETRDLPWDRLTEGAVSENVKEVVPAPQAGFLITDILSTE